MKTKKIITLLSATFLPVVATSALAAGCGNTEEQKRQNDNKVITVEIAKANELVGKLSDPKYKDVNKDKISDLIKKANKIITNKASTQKEREEIINELKVELANLETKKQEIDKKEKPTPPIPEEDKNKELKRELKKLINELKEFNKVVENNEVKKLLDEAEKELQKSEATAESLGKFKKQIEDKLPEIKKQAGEKNYEDFVKNSVIKEYEPNFIDEVKDQLDAYYTLYYKDEAVTKELITKLGIEAEDREKIYTISYDSTSQKVLAKAKLNGKEFIKEFAIKFISADPKKWVENNDGLKLKEGLKLDEISADKFNKTSLNSKFEYNKIIEDVPFIKFMGIDRSPNQIELNKEGQAKLIFKFKNTSNKKEYTYEHLFTGLKKYTEDSDAILKLWKENKLDV